MSSLFHYPDHAEAALRRRLAQDVGKPVMEATIRALVGRTQLAEDVLWDIYEHGHLDGAEGVELDRLGAIVGEARQGRDDDTYRLWVQARSLANRSPGRVDDLLRLGALLIGAGATIAYVDHTSRDAEILILITGSTEDLSQISMILDTVRPAGVSLQIGEVPGSGAGFAFDAGPGWDVGQLAGIVP